MKEEGKEDAAAGTVAAPAGGDEDGVTAVLCPSAWAQTCDESFLLTTRLCICGRFAATMTTAEMLIDWDPVGNKSSWNCKKSGDRGPSARLDGIYKKADNDQHKLCFGKSTVSWSQKTRTQAPVINERAFLRASRLCSLGLGCLTSEGELLAAQASGKAQMKHGGWKHSVNWKTPGNTGFNYCYKKLKMNLHRRRGGRSRWWETTSWRNVSLSQKIGCQWRGQRSAEDSPPGGKGLQWGTPTWTHPPESPSCTGCATVHTLHREHTCPLCGSKF